MTPASLRAAIASARLRPRMYSSDAHDLAGYLHGMIAGVAAPHVDTTAAWQVAWSAWWSGGKGAIEDTSVCDVAEATVAALWPQGDAPAGDECAAFSAAPLDTPMPPAFVAALASLSPAQPAALDLDAIEARVAQVYADGTCGCVDDARALIARVRELEAKEARVDLILASFEGPDGSIALAEQVDRWRGEACYARHVAQDLFPALDLIGDDGWPLRHAAPDAMAAEVKRLRGQLAAAQPAPLDFHASLAAARNGRFVPPSTWARCLACGGTRADVDGAPCEPCRGTGQQPPPLADLDLCPRCGALDLDHVCPKSAATVAGEAFAAEHPYAAGAIMGSATAREGKG